MLPRAFVYFSFRIAEKRADFVHFRPFHSGPGRDVRLRSDPPGGRHRGPIRDVRPGTVALVGAPTNLSATRKVVRELRAAERISPDLAGLVQLAICSAEILDDALEADTPAYALSALVRTHRDSLVTLLDRAVTYQSDALDELDELLARAMTPSPGTRGNDDAPGATPWS